MYYAFYVRLSPNQSNIKIPISNTNLKINILFQLLCTKKYFLWKLFLSLIVHLDLQLIDVNKYVPLVVII